MILQRRVSGLKRIETLQRRPDKDNWYGVLLENLPQKIFYKDRDSVYVSCNKNCARDLNISPDEYAGKTDYDFFPKDLAEKYRADDKRVIESGNTMEIDETFIQNGRELIVHTVKTPVKDEKGNVVGVLGIFWDITERRAIEDALKQSAAKYQTVVENVSDFIFMLDEGCTVLSVNQAAARAFGKRPEELVGKSIFDLFPSELASKYSANVEKVFESGKALTDESVMIAGDKETWISTSLSPVKSSSGQVTSIIGVSRDMTERKELEEELFKTHQALETRVQERTTELVNVNEALQAEVTERKRAEERLRESEEKYRILIDNSQDGVFIIQDAEMRFVNEAFARMTGYTVEESIGRDFREFVAPEDRDMVADRYRRRQAGEEDLPKEYEFHILHKDGKTRILVNMNVGLVQYHGGVASIGTVKNITEKKKLEAQLLRAQRMESIGTLSDGIAHDMNNVLSPITLSLHMLKEKFTDNASQELLDILESSAKRGSDLIKQVRSFALGVESEHKTLQAAPIISEISQIAKETFPRNIEIQTTISDDLCATSGDASQLHQVLMNLCVNARDAMPNGGILKLSAENVFVDEDFARINIEAKVGPYIVITVSDTGVGIPPEIMDRIFDPFFTTKPPGKGTGLGLPITLAIIKNHGGFINVYSEVGNGTAFKVYLPAIQEAEAQKPDEQLELPSGHGELILVVEDEAMISKITKLVLETHGYRVLTTPDGAEAITLYEQNKSDVKAVIMDMMLPVIDGPTCINALRKVNPDVKVIAVSGLVENDRLTSVNTAPTQAFLPKPYTSDVLLKTVNKVIQAK